MLPQDECNVSTNDSCHRAWLTEDQQPLKRKGNGRGVHISDWICEPIGRLVLSPEQVATQILLPKDEQLRVFDACKITFPGKGHDTWWDLDQLREQTKDAVDIFKYMTPNTVGIWIFDCSSAHEGYAANTLNVNNMNIHPGGKQKHLHNTMIPLNNPPPNLATQIHKV